MNLAIRVLLVIVASASVNAYAQQEQIQRPGPPALQELTSFEEPTNQGPLAWPENAPDSASHASATPQANATLGAAPSLTRIFVYAVASSNCGW
jgi:hypothetical protein